jgi:hypothetical protein
MTQLTNHDVGVSTEAIPRQRVSGDADAGHGPGRHRSTQPSPLHRLRLAIVAAGLVTFAAVGFAAGLLVNLADDTEARPQPTPASSDWSSLLTNPMSSAPGTPQPNGDAWIEQFLSRGVR